MKKSEMYHIAMLSVLNDETICAEDKLGILEVLLDAESMAEWSERNEASV